MHQKLILARFAPQHRMILEDQSAAPTVGCLGKIVSSAETRDAAAYDDDIKLTAVPGACQRFRCINAVSNTVRCLNHVPRVAIGAGVITHAPVSP